ncbi:hypothetical protein RJ639_038468 [Escallonia herrerae]|uniref:Reverse transcriptase RNase H-like domain-containing protein n=1 Tax=Escallonia herrerae TaxID=1293975 RepID=A0AA88WM19_9ASTE|nr:hypothetical protein RJ639_038468 [Escallonia herrerae]
MKFPAPRGFGLVKGDQTLARRCYVASCRPEETFSIDNQHDKATEYLASASLLSKPVPGEELFLYLAVAESAISAVLVREEGGRQLPIYYVRNVLQGAEQRYPNTKKLAFALLIAARKLRPYFQSHTIVVLTDKPLRRILHKPNLSSHLIPLVCRIRRAPSLLSTLSSLIPIAMWGMDILGPFPPATAQRKFVMPMSYTKKSHPQTNGQIEVTNHILLQGIKKKLDGAKGLWVDELPKILWAYNTTTRIPMGKTPFSLSFCMEALIPIEIGLPSLRLTTYDPVQNEEALRANLDLINEWLKQAAMCLAASQH